MASLYDLVPLVSADGLARVGTDDQQATVVVCLDTTTDRVVVVTADAWMAAHGSLPTDPAQAEADTARSTRRQQQQARQQRQQAAQQRLADGKPRLREIRQEMISLLDTLSGSPTAAQTRTILRAVRDLARFDLDLALVLRQQADDGQE